MKILQRFWKPFVWLAALGLVVWVLQTTPLRQIWAVVQGLGVWQIVIILVINAGILLLFGLRWWLILKAQGYPLPYLAITRYRLASFGVSYFTPGPQFGGEPLQVYYVKKNHDVPIETSVAAITLDKLFELLANFSFLVFGLVVLLSTDVMGVWGQKNILLIAPGLLSLPFIFLWLLKFGVHPISWLGRKVLIKYLWWQKIESAIASSEREMSLFLNQTPKVIGFVLLASGLVWGGLVFEYWLIIKFLGLALSLTEVIIVITAARIAFLTPLPGALGALEVSQIAAMQVLGINPVYGVSLALLIRARDILFGIIGLAWGGILTKKF